MRSFGMFFRKSIPWATLRSWLAYAAIPLAGLATAPMMARALGPEGRGELAAILQPLTVAGAFAAIGIPAAITFFIGRGHSVRATQKAALPIILISTTAVYIALLLYSAEIARVTNVPQFLICLIWLSIIPGALLSSRRSVWQGLRQFGPIDIERATAGASRFALIAFLFVLGVSSTPMYVVIYVAAGLLASGFLFRRLPDRTGSFERPRTLKVTNILRYSLLASIGTIMATLNNRLDQAVLPSAIGARELGLYSIAVTVAEVPFIVTAVTARNLLAESSHRAGGKSLTKTFTVGLSGVLIASLTLGVIAPFFVPLVFGSSFAPAIQAIWMLLIATFLGSIAEGINAIVAGRGRPGLASFPAGIGAGISIGLLWLTWQGMSLERAAGIAIAAQCGAAIAALLVLSSISRSSQQRSGSDLAAKDQDLKLRRS